MCDEADIAQERIEIELQRAIDAARQAPRMTITGRCYNCNEPTMGHFCEAGCREDWIKRQRMAALRFDADKFELGEDDSA